MQPRNVLPRALALLAVVGLGAFALLGRPSRADSAPPAPKASLAPSLEHSIQAPLVVQYDDQPTQLATGETELTVHLNVRSPLRFPVSFKASLPRGATLTSGELEETLTLTEVGVVHRTFRFRATDEMSGANPFRVVVHGEAPDRSMGLHADRTFPAQTTATVPAFAGPRPPGGRPPGPLKR